MGARKSTNTVGRRLRALRKRRKLTQEQLAKKVRGCPDTSYIGKIERGQSASLKTLNRIAEALGVPIMHFFEQRGGRLSSKLESALADPLRGGLLKEMVRMDPDDALFLAGILKQHRAHRRPKGRARA